MIAGAIERLGYLKYLFSAKAWRWGIHAVDLLVTDHIEPWTKITRGKRCQVHPSVSFRRPENIILGENVRLQNHVCLWASPGSRIVVGDDSGLGPGTRVFSSNHQYQPGVPYVKQPWVEKDVIIGKNVWVGAGCTILSGVNIGDNVVVAAGSVVNKDIAANSLVAGVPARVLKGPGSGTAS